MMAGKRLSFIRNKNTLGQRQMICSHPGIACPGGIGQGNRKKTLLLLFKFDLPGISEFRQQIKAFC